MQTSNHMKHLFVPMPVDWFRTRTAKQLRRRDPANESRFLFMVCLAYQTDDDGRVVGSDNLPLSAEDLADDHDRDVDAWESFIKACHELDLVETDEDGAFRLTSFRYWTRGERRPSDRPEATRERKRKQREREKKAEQVDAISENVTRVTTGHELSRMSRQEERRGEERREEQSRAEKRRAEQSRGESERREASRGAPLEAAAAVFSEHDFFEAAASVYESLSGGRKLPSKERGTIRDEIGSWPPPRTGWQDYAGAVILAAQKTQHEEQAGKDIRNPWLYTLRAAPDQLDLAAQYNISSRRAGVEPDYRWEPPEVAK